MARLRSWINWLNHCDANTKLFHHHARHRKRKNFIGKLVLEDKICTSQHTINLGELGIAEHDLSDLDLPFTEEEVWNTIKQMPSDKAPGPDGYTSRFYKTCWPIIKNDIMAAISAIWSRKVVNLGILNCAYITLLPKKEDADQHKDFRPISLVHSFAKLVTKLMANRLAPKMQKIVSPVQSAFIKGRFIQDNFMLVQQTARYLHQ